MPNSVFVGNLPYTTTTEKLSETFRACGEVIGAKIVIDKDGKSKGYGFVTYLNEEDAKKAIAKMNGIFLDKRELRVGPARDRNDNGQRRGALGYGFNSRQMHADNAGAARNW